MKERDYISHYGIGGMHWGVRRFQNPDGSLTAAGKERYGSDSVDQNHFKNPDGTKNYKKIKKEASEDAEEYARAKAYYGEGAGTRRKRIKNRISEKMKDEDYKKEFEEALAKQDMEKHQKAADRERKTQDAKDKVAKFGRGLKNLILGASTTSVAAIAVYNIAKMLGVDVDSFIDKAKDTVMSKLGR